MRTEQEIKKDLREMLDKEQKLETNLVGVRRYIDVLKKELAEVQQ